MLKTDQINHLQQWLGREQSNTDSISGAPIAALNATLDRDNPQALAGHPLPELWHWLYFLPTTLQSELGEDGHAKKGDFLPPVPLPRRMWAGSQLTFHSPLTVGDKIERVSCIDAISHKVGRSGDLVFVRVKHTINRIEQNTTESNSNRTLSITEFHDIVYRDAADAANENSPNLSYKSAPLSSDWEHAINADDVLLFRYSALTFNGHRIHYDRRYATEVEHYPGLIVHGPLIATLLLDAMRKELGDLQIAHFEFKSFKPIFDIHPFFVCGLSASTDATAHSVKTNTVKLWAKDHQGDIAMEASATLT